MNKQKILFLTFGVLLILIFGAGVWLVIHPVQPFVLSGGTVGDILPADREAVFFIKGEWLASWSEEGPSALPDKKEDFTEVSEGFRGIWNSRREALYRPSTGSAAYYCSFQTSGRRGIQAVSLPAFASASRVIVNGEEVALQGRPGASFSEETALSRPVTVLFNQQADLVEIVIHISNYRKFSGGAPELGIEYGTPPAIYQFLSVTENLIFTLVLFIVGFTIYCGIRSVFQKGDRYHFFLALGFALLLARIFLSNFFILEAADVIKGLPYELPNRLTYLFLFLVLPVFINFGFQFLPGVGNSRRAAVISQVIGVTAAVAVLALPGRLLAYVEPLVSLSLAGGTGFLVYLGIRGIRKKITLSLLFTLGMGILFSYTTFLLLFDLGIFTSNFVYGAGLLFCLLVLALVLAVRERRFLQQTSVLRNRLDEVTASRNSVLVHLADEGGESLDKVNELTKTLIQGALGPLNSDQLVTASLILSNSMLHQNLLYDTIDLVNLDEGLLGVRKDSINLYSVVSLNIGSLQPVVMGLSLRMLNEVPRDVPQVWADDKKLGQILFTFFSFGIENATHGVVSVFTETIDEGVRISVKIEGVSSNDSLEKGLKVLEDSYKYESDDRSDSAVLRLSLAKELIRLHGSELKAERDEKSVSFIFDLPLFIQHKAADEPVAEELAIHLDAIQNLQPLLEEVESERDIRILAAAGDAGSLQIIKSQLASMNYQIQSVMTGEDVLANVGEERLDLIVIDSSLKDLSSFEVCRALRNEFTPDELPVILIIEDSSEVMETLTAGASDYLRKPYQQEEFLTRVNTHLQLSKINSMYSQFVPREFLKALGQDNIIDLKLGDQVQREMTILFVDIRAFTNLSENMTPQENFKFINSYLSQFSPIITRNGGFVDKFIGDAIMALYPDKPEDAIRTAIEMVEYVKIYNGYRANCGYDPINIGIGIHTGKMILGIVGDSQRMQGTVISDAVNLASRIQDVTKLYKSNVVISQETFVKLENPTDYNFRFLGKVKVKGKDKSVSLFEIFNSDDEKIRDLKEETKGEFETAILLFAKRDFLEAKNLFEKVLTVHPDDMTAHLFLDRAEKFLSSEKKSFLTSL